MPGPDLNPVTQFRELYERDYTAVFRTVYAIVLDRGEAEDLAQESFVRAYRARQTYQPSAPVGAWLHRIAVNLALSHLRRRKLSRFLPVRLYTGPERDPNEQSDARSLVEQALAELTPKLRAVVALHFYQGYTREEIASMLGVPSGTVASRMAKAMVLMRRRLESGGPGDQLLEPARSRS